MNKSEILKLLQAEPFAPFTIHLSSGRSLRVTHPETVILTPSKILVATNYNAFQADSIEHVSYLHVASLQEA